MKTLGVFLFFLAMYVATAGGHLYSPDEEVMFRTTESLATRGRLAIDPIPGPGGTFASARGTDGLEYAQYGIANSLFAVPLHWAGSLACRFVSDDAARRALDFRTTLYAPEGPGRGHALLRRFAVSFFGSLVAAATCALLYFFVRRLYGVPEIAGGGGRGASDKPATSPHAVAFLTALLYGAGTMAWPHARTYFSEPLATFFVLLALVLGRGRGGPLTLRQAFGCGAAFALALMARLDSAFVAPAIALFLAMRHLEGGEGGIAAALRRPAGAVVRDLFRADCLARAAMAALPVAAFGVLTLGLNWMHFGSPFASAYKDQPEGVKFTTPLLAGLFGFLFSAGKSIFLFSPALLLGWAGFRAFARRHLTVAVGAAGIVLMTLLIHSRWQNWPGGWCWGPRHAFMIHAFAILPAAGFLADWSRARAAVFFPVLATAIVVQVYGCSQSFIDFYILYYRTPDREPNAYVMFSAEDATPARLIAPINDSIYVPQNTQWYRYAEMERLGYTDNLWLRLARRAEGTEPPVN